MKDYLKFHYDTLKTVVIAKIKYKLKLIMRAVISPQIHVVRKVAWRCLVDWSASMFLDWVAVVFHPITEKRESPAPTK